MDPKLLTEEPRVYLFVAGSLCVLSRPWVTLPNLFDWYRRCFLPIISAVPKVTSSISSLLRATNLFFSRSKNMEMSSRLCSIGEFRLFRGLLGDCWRLGDYWDCRCLLCIVGEPLDCLGEANLGEVRLQCWLLSPPFAAFKLLISAIAIILSRFWTLWLIKLRWLVRCF